MSECHGRSSRQPSAEEKGLSVMLKIMKRCLFKTWRLELKNNQTKNRRRATDSGSRSLSASAVVIASESQGGHQMSSPGPKALHMFAHWLDPKSSRELCADGVAESCSWGNTTILRAEEGKWLACSLVCMNTGASPGPGKPCVCTVGLWKPVWKATLTSEGKSAGY